jgi:hypothetical protein
MVLFIVFSRLSGFTYRSDDYADQLHATNLLF